jgi:hypothetical protein
VFSAYIVENFRIAHQNAATPTGEFAAVRAREGVAIFTMAVTMIAKCSEIQDVGYLSIEGSERSFKIVVILNARPIMKLVE